MKKRRLSTKLHLSRETVRNLLPELASVVGAVPTGTCDCPPTAYLCPREETGTAGCQTYGNFCTIDCQTWRGCTQTCICATQTC